MISKIQFVSTYKVFGVPIRKSVCGYEGKIKISLKKPVPGGKIHVESKNASGRVAIPLINTVIDISQGKQKTFFTSAFPNPFVSRGFSHVAFFVRITDKDGTLIEEKKLMQKLFTGEDIQKDLRDNLIFILILLTSITSLVMFLFR